MCGLCLTGDGSTAVHTHCERICEHTHTLTQRGRRAAIMELALVAGGHTVRAHNMIHARRNYAHVC